MSVVSRVDSEVTTGGLSELISSMGLPVRPSVLEDVDRLLASDDAAVEDLSRLISLDVALSAAVLKVANSPIYSGSRNVGTLHEAVSFLGLKRLRSLLTDVLLRAVLAKSSMALPRFWDVSAKRAFACRTMAEKLNCLDAESAQSFGLFCDVGVPLLAQKFPDYLQTLQLANNDVEQSFTAVEQAAHQTDHALVGAIMARTWGLATPLCLAIRLHHDYNALANGALPKSVGSLIAFSVMAERMIQSFEGRNHSREWEKGGAIALAFLGLNEEEFDELSDVVHEGFGHSVC